MMLQDFFKNKFKHGCVVLIFFLQISSKVLNRTTTDYWNLQSHFQMAELMSGCFAFFLA